MDTYPIYCSACDGREAWVAPSNLLYCRKCGTLVTLRGESVEYRTIRDPREWQGAPWAVDGLSQQERRESVNNYVQEHTVILPDEIISVLAHTDSRAEVEFILPILHTSGWRATGRRQLSNGHLRLSVQEPIEGYVVDFLFEDLLSGQRFIVEIDGPTHARAKKKRQDNLRDEVLRKRRYRVVRIGILEARKLGLSLRRDLENARGTEIRRTGIVPTPPVQQNSQRVWSTHELAYGVYGLPYSRRVEVLKDWLRVRKLSFPDDMVEVLALCDYAGEVLFAGELLKIPVWKRIAENCVQCKYYSLHVQHTIGPYVVDFAFEFANRLEVVEINPATHHAFDWLAARKQDAALEKDGVKVTRIPAKDAKQTGRLYATELLPLMPGALPS